jgi:NMD protein affecting ribosome stability and mRNA decay
MRKKTPPPSKFECRICGDKISEEAFEEQDEMCSDCYEEESNTMEEEEFIDL